MSCVLIATPLIIAGWPAITACVTAAVASLGFSVVAGAADEVVTGRSMKQLESAETNSTSKVIIDAEESEVLDQAMTAPGGEQIVVTKNGVTATFSRDARGGLKLCMEGDHLSKSQLRKMGEELMGRVTQQYAYHKVVTELKERGMSIIEETVSADKSVKIRIRA